nr:Chain C, ARG-GLU-PRO-MET-LEU-GLN [Severe acute respiratory syndrome coronavirus 2]7MB9_D Chain D, ARG-GLU-PRO-MET-LEU-GLN [Severe acute respiratory syndrome coronavirus 2]
REPMLQ